MTNINKYAESDRAFLKRQIELIDPTVIICGYTIKSLNIILYNTKKKGVKNYKKPHKDWHYSTKINDKNVIVLDFYHPANWLAGGDLWNYSKITEIYQKALQSINS